MTVCFLNLFSTVQVRGAERSIPSNAFSVWIQASDRPQSLSHAASGVTTGAPSQELRWNILFRDSPSLA